MQLTVASTNRPRPADETEVMAFLLVPEFSMMSFASAVEPLRIANRLSGRPLYRWFVVSKDGQPVKGMRSLKKMMKELDFGGRSVVQVERGGGLRYLIMLIE